MERRLLKFKHGSGSSDKAVLLKYEVKNGEDWDALTFESNDEPHSDLKKAMSALVPDLLENCEINDQEYHAVSVISVSCTHKDMGEDGIVRGYVITGTRELKNCNSPLVLNMPHKTAAPYSETDEAAWDNCLSFETLSRLQKFEQETFAYLDGKRAQSLLPFDGEKQAEPAGAT